MAWSEVWLLVTRRRLSRQASFQWSLGDGGAVWRMRWWFAGAHRLAAKEKNEALKGRKLHNARRFVWRTTKTRQDAQSESELLLMEGA